MTPRGARGRHRRQARRAGGGARRGGDLEGSHRHRELHGLQPHGQVRNIATVTTAVARGDLSRKITVDVKGEMLELKETINTMVDQLNGFASEVSRVAREVGTEGKLGGQAQVPGVAGTWKDLTDNVNSMASNLTGASPQHRRGDHGRGRGDLSPQDHRRCEGRNSGAEEHHQHDGGSAQRLRRPKSAAWRAKWAPKASSAARREVPGVAGTWKDLTDNVNSMASNLTGQVRNIAEVTTAVANGDLSQEDHRRRARRNSGVEEHASTRWSISSTPSPPK